MRDQPTLAVVGGKFVDLKELADRLTALSDSAGGLRTDPGRRSWIARQYLISQYPTRESAVAEANRVLTEISPREAASARRCARWTRSFVGRLLRRLGAWR